MVRKSHFIIWSLITCCWGACQTEDPSKEPDEVLSEVSNVDFSYDAGDRQLTITWSEDENANMDSVIVKLSPHKDSIQRIAKGVKRCAFILEKIEPQFALTIKGKFRNNLSTGISRTVEDLVEPDQITGFEYHTDTRQITLQWGIPIKTLNFSHVVINSSEWTEERPLTDNQTTWTFPLNVMELEQEITYSIVAVGQDQKRSKPLSVSVKPKIMVDSRDYSEYPVIGIGTQYWTATNMAYLPRVFPSNSPQVSVSGQEPRYYVYSYNGTDINEAKRHKRMLSAGQKEVIPYEEYGVIYNFPASEGACPPGWHLPSDADWQKLEQTIGVLESDLSKTGTGRGESNEVSKKLKTLTGWFNAKGEEIPGTNENGFAAKPGGMFLDKTTEENVGEYVKIENHAFWWTSTKERSVPPPRAYIRWINTLNAGIYRGFLEGAFENGYYVRCVRDE